MFTLPFIWNAASSSISTVLKEIFMVLARIDGQTIGRTVFSWQSRVAKVDDEHAYDTDENESSIL